MGLETLGTSTEENSIDLGSRVDTSGPLGTQPEKPHV